MKQNKETSPTILEMDEESLMSTLAMGIQRVILKKLTS